MRGERSRRKTQLSPAPWVLAVLLVWTVAQRADAQPEHQPLLHEFLPPDTKEDLALSATTASGELPAAIQTPSGTVKPPDLSSNPSHERVYREPAAQDASFRPDRDTRRPDVEHYDDPFSPTLTPFKRLSAWDAVRADYTLYVRGSEGAAGGRYRPVVVDGAPGGTEGAGEEHFFGDMTVGLRAGRYVRIPTVGAGSRLHKLISVPDVPVTVWRDGADNWFARGERSEEVRLITELSIARDSFGSPFADVRWSALRSVPPQPAAHRRAFARVAAAIAISKAMPPAEVVSRMVSYFRSFEPSDESPRQHGDIYLDLALSQRGVCRHRAFAFLVTALNIGIPARFVANEAHAWVEVHDSRMWHRIDLGGAAGNLAEQPHLDRPPHVPPPDPYAWPIGRDSGEDLAHRRREAALRELIDSGSSGPNGALGRSVASADGAAPGASTSDPSAAAGGSDSQTPPEEELPDSLVTVDTLDRDIFRGYPLHIQGRVRNEGRPCSNLRVDVVVLVGQGQKERRVGSLSTDDQGVYDGAIVLPRDLPIGDHELIVTTGGDGQCGPGEAW